MPQNFVLAFGGTGSRCVEALTYLYASRSLSDPAHILLIDPDDANGNVAVTLEQLHRYHAVQQHVRYRDGSPRAFFSTPLNEGHKADSFFWQYPNQTRSFGSLIDYASQDRSHKELLGLLYDEDDLAMTFERGYVGRAHIGSLDLFRTLSRALRQVAEDEHRERATARDGAGSGPRRSDPLSVFFRELRSAVQGQQRANLIVLGSIFGGTGASGIPAVPPLIKEILPHLHASLNIACVQMAPYFTFDAPAGPEDPDSSVHPLATQTALYHYALTDTGYNRIYLIGAPDRPQTNDLNRPGGVDQRNRAHYAELAAALASAAFFADPPEPGSHVQVFASGADEVTWGKLPFGREVMIQHGLVSFATFCLLHELYLYPDLSAERHREARWCTELTRQTEQTLGGKEKEITLLRDFSRRYLEWAVQVQNTADSPLFNVRDRDQEAALATVTAGGSRVDDAYHSLYSRMNRGTRIDQPSPIGWYVDAVARAVDQFCHSNYSWWSNKG